MIITKQSGIVLYRKVFLKSIDKPIITAGLIIALHKWSAQTIGLPISYVELSNCMKQILFYSFLTTSICIRNISLSFGSIVTDRPSFTFALMRSFVHNGQGLCA